MRRYKQVSTWIATFFLLNCILPVALGYECRQFLTVPRKKNKEIHFDLTPLGGERTSSKETNTPPSRNEAQVKMNLCGDDTIPKNPSLSDEDQCPEGTKVCLTLINHKSSSQDQSRVTAVIPIWTADLAEDNIETNARENEEGVDITVYGDEYAGTRQTLKLQLLCSPMATDPDPTFDSYADGVLSLSWSTPDACPKALDGSEDAPIPGNSRNGGGGFWSFLKFVFWMVVLVLIAYFAIGIYYNYTTYGAKGVDLLPHKDFWTDLPTMMNDLFSHLATNLRGGSSSSSSRRGGYTSLG